MTIATNQLPSAIIGTPYVAVLDATGGTPAYKWSIAGGQLPSGVSLASATGIISGTPTESGNFSVSLAANDSSNPSQVKSSALTIAVAAPPLKISISTLASATVGTPYSQTLQTSGGTAPFRWSVTSGALPAGLSLTSSTGVISGTPTTSGADRFTAAVHDSGHPTQTYSVAMSIIVAASQLKITTVAVPSAPSGAAYSQALQVSGGTPAYKWSIASGSLPAGLTLASTGIISGTPTTSGVATFTAAVADHSIPVQTTSAPFSISVGGTPLTIATPVLGSATLGAGYSQSLKAIGGSAPYSWSITSGSLPAGTTLTPSTGLISGVPTASGTSTFIATVTDSGSPTQSLSVSTRIVVAPSPVSIVASTLPSVLVGKSYSQTLQATGGTAPYAWSVTSGTLPAGLAFASTGTISGTPTTSGTFSFTATVTDSSSPTQTASANKTVTITSTPLAVVPVTLPSVTVGTSYSKTLAAIGGVGPYVWSITSGKLPQGLNLVPNAGTINGIPTASGVSNFTATVTDSSSPAQSVPATAAIVVTPTLLAITSSGLTSTTVGASYSQSLQASGGSAPYSWTVTSGTLPTGLSLSPSTGLISGISAASGKFTFTATVTDSSSPAQLTSATNTISVTPALAPPAILAPLVLSITTTALPSLTAGTSYTQTLQATGGTTPYAWQIASGQLPAGLSLSPNGTISGVPTSGSASTFTVSVTDSGSPAQTQSAGLSIGSATSPLTITSSVLASGTAGTAYSQVLSASGGTPAYTWSITSGSLPPGMVMAATSGVISGTPTTSGTSTITVAVHDNGNPVQTQSTTASIVVAAQPSSGTGNTWYVDAAIGGTRYSTNVPSGLCDGTADTAPVGNTPNQHCAFKDVRMLYQDGSPISSPQSPFPAWGWVGAGGDTYYVMGSIANGISYRVGNDTLAACSSYPCFGVQNQPQNAGMLVPPSGTSGAHTHLYGGCMITGTCDATNSTTLTQLFGGWGTYNVLSLYGAVFVDVAGLDLTDHYQCTLAGGAHFPCKSNSGTPYDYAVNGIQLYNTTHDVTLSHVSVHGVGGNGIFGPPGGTFTADDLQIVGNGIAGWNADPGDGTTGFGSLTVTHFNISWNGCAEEYPLVDAQPYVNCADDSGGGYGDGFGTTTVTSSSPWNVSFQHGTVSYNTQDGLDALHVNCAGCTIDEEYVLAYGSEGQQLKAGDGAVATLLNNVIVGNCEALLTGVPGRPSQTYDNLGDPCRAGNVPVVMFLVPGQRSVFANNTTYESGAIGLQIEYSSTIDSTNLCTYENNVYVGFLNVGKGAYPSPLYSNGGSGGGGGLDALACLQYPGSVWKNNLTYGYNSGYTCPGTDETNAVCGVDPGLVDETYHVYGYGNMAPASSSSPVIGAGVPYPGISLDYTGYTRPDPPSIGAYEYH